MENFIQKMRQLLKDDLLKTSNFGNSQTEGTTGLIWVATSAIQRVAQLLANDPELQLNWLENLSIVELEEGFVTSYFVRSTVTPYQLVIRISQMPDKSHDKHSKSNLDPILYIPTTKETWPMVEPMENEMEEMFGVFFERDRANKLALKRGRKILYSGLQGFPLRKGFKFPENNQQLDSQPLDGED